jgi:hypothetical protein
VAPFIRKKLAITSPTSGGRSVGIVRSRAQTMEFVVLFVDYSADSASITTMLGTDSFSAELQY